MRKQVARLFEIHIADVRNQIAENSKFIIKHVSSELKRSKERNEQVNEELRADIEHRTRAATSGSKRYLTNALLGFMGFALVAVTFQLFRSQEQIGMLAQNHSELVEISKRQSDMLGNINQSAPIATAPQPSTRVVQSQNIRSRVDYPALLDTVSWAMNVKMNFAFGQPPLGDSQVMQLRTLVQRLDKAGFEGTITLNVHYGNFCVVQNQNGSWNQADNTGSFGQCMFARDVLPPMTTNDVISVSYLEFEQNSAPLQSGRINIALNLEDYESPLMPYPVLNSSDSSQLWNSTANGNNRVAISFEMDGMQLGRN